jgi:hypothetical protein
LSVLEALATVLSFNLPPMMRCGFSPVIYA